MATYIHTHNLTLSLDRGYVSGS